MVGKEYLGTPHNAKTMSSSPPLKISINTMRFRRPFIKRLAKEGLRVPLRNQTYIKAEIKRKFHEEAKTELSKLSPQHREQQKGNIEKTHEKRADDAIHKVEHVFFKSLHGKKGLVTRGELTKAYSVLDKAHITHSSYRNNFRTLKRRVIAKILKEQEQEKIKPSSVKKFRANPQEELPEEAPGHVTSLSEITEKKQISAQPTALQKTPPALRPAGKATVQAVPTGLYKTAKPSSSIAQSFSAQSSMPRAQSTPSQKKVSTPGPALLSRLRKAA